MSIKGYVDELKAIKLEQKSLRERLKILTNASKVAEQNILGFLEEKQQPGVKYNGTVITIDRATKRAHKSNKSKNSDSIEYLQSLGVDDPENVLKCLLESRRGAPMEKPKIKMNNINQ
jgi:hypothetical protein